MEKLGYIERKRMEEFNVITEFKNGFGVSDLPICIYKMRVRDFEKRHNEIIS